MDIHVNGFRARTSIRISSPFEPLHGYPYGYPCGYPCRIIRATDSSTRAWARSEAHGTQAKRSSCETKRLQREIRKIEPTRLSMIQIVYKGGWTIVEHKKKKKIKLLTLKLTVCVCVILSHKRKFAAFFSPLQICSSGGLIYYVLYL